MVKQKNHTARNNTYKAHRNGIKKPLKQRHIAQTGVRHLAGVLVGRVCTGIV
jgi:hypothetical protein